MATGKQSLMWAFLTIVVFLILSAINGLLAYTFKNELKKKKINFNTVYQAKLDAKTEELAKIQKELDDYKKKVAEKKLKIAELTHQLSIARFTSKLMQARVEYRNAMVSSIRSMTENIAKVRDELVSYYNTKREEETNAHRTALEDLQNKAASLEQRKADLDQQIIAREKAFRDEMSRLSTQVDQIRQDIDNFQKLKLPSVREEEADGRVLLVNNQYNFVIVNIGKKDHVTFGQRFKVYQYDDNRVPREKGFVICRMLGDHYCYAQIVSVVDKANPIIEGDLISSPLYSRDHRIKIAVVGQLRGFLAIATDEKMKKAMQEKLRRAIEQYGAIYSPEVTADCDYVVVSDKVAAMKEEGELTPEQKQYKLAKEYDLPIISEDEFLRYLGD